MAAGSYQVTDISTNTLTVQVTGDWVRESVHPDIGDLVRMLDENRGIRVLQFDGSRLGDWDSMLVLFLSELKRVAIARDMKFDAAALPGGAQQLLTLAFAVPEREGAKKSGEPRGLLVQVGEKTTEVLTQAYDLLSFMGEVVYALIRFVAGRARYRARDLFLFIQEAGFEALPIVSLISFLIGIILAFVGAYQLAIFGAEIYVADLVAIGMVREMGPIMAAIIMAGRTGAAYAAQLGTMQVNEEIDAFRTLGVSPMEYLVLPRIVALTLMMPLLVVYADILGIIGGLLVGVFLFDITMVQYINQTLGALDLTNIFLGVFKGLLFGLLISSAGCFQGMQSGRSSAAVGQATTAAVVMSIVGIVVFDSILAVVTTILDI